MTMLTVWMTALLFRFRDIAVHRRRDERGDVPGWVLITVMTAGLVAAIWAVAGPQLAQMVRDALNSVRS